MARARLDSENIFGTLTSDQVHILSDAAQRLELPAGKLYAGEEPAACAVRELEEETGFKAARLDSLGWMWSTPGFTDERIWLFIASDLEPGRQKLDKEEVLEVISLTRSEALSRIERGEIRDAKTLCTLLLAERFLGREA